ncbi:MAG: branched-chain amino acid ABC transporter permease [Thermoleophilaceae bacterium]
MAEVVQHVVDALSLGGIYAALTLGLGLLFSVMRLVNFAYGELIMAGAFAMYLLQDTPLLVLVAGTLAVTIGVALVTERVAFRPLRGVDPMTLLLASFAVSVMLQNGARMVFGPIAKGVAPYPFLEQDLIIGSVRISVLDLTGVVLTAALIGAVAVMLQKTVLGMQIRAAAEDAEMADLLGVKANRVIAAAFAIAGVLAAVATLILIFQQGAVSVTVGFLPVLIAFVAVVVGGLGSLPGAALGGLLIGATTGLLDAALPTDLAPFRDAFLFSIMMALLVIRPQGLVPQKEARV